MTQNMQTPALPPRVPLTAAADMADLVRLALTGWMPTSAGAGLEALFDRMEAGR